MNKENLIIEDGVLKGFATHIVVPKDVKEIGECAFYDCKTLSSFVIQNGVSRIGKQAFRNCVALQKMHIPASVDEMIDNPFECCPNLKELTVSPNNKRYKSENNCIIEKATNILICGCQASVIPDGVKVIGSSAFYGCHNLENVNIPDGVREIGDVAFVNCRNLKKFSVPNSVIRIGENAFGSCINLEEVNISNGVEEIGYCAFVNCQHLKVINYLGTIQQWGNIRKGDEWGDPSDKYTIHCYDGDIKQFIPVCTHFIP